MANNSHYFHAEAHALTGRLNLPFEEEIKKQAFVKLEGEAQQLLSEIDANKQIKDEKEPENYFSQHAKNFRLEGLISYSAAHTQVSGHKSKKHKGAFVTLATSAVEDLNVLNVVTADRVVAQVSTTHFPDGYSPKVTFLGTHFENLRIARHRAEPFLNLDLVGPRPMGEKALYVEMGREWLKAVEAQYKKLKDWKGRLEAELQKKNLFAPSADWLANKYHGGTPIDNEIVVEVATARDKDIELGKAAATGNKDIRKATVESTGITCSLVENTEIEPIKGTDALGEKKTLELPGKPFGHVIHVHDFGTIFLAELIVNHNSFDLTMIRLELGCLADGTLSAVACNVNGGSGGGH